MIVHYPNLLALAYPV